MTGPEHFTEAQRLLDEDVDYSQPDDVALVLAHAQVHATLALVAATVEASYTEIDVRRPTRAEPDSDEPAFPGTPWGRALHGALS